MTIYEIQLPAEIEQQAKAIINQTGYLQPDQKRANIHTLTRLYLRYIEPHNWQPHEDRFEAVFHKWLTCNKCVNKVYEYFETRYDNE